MLSTVGWNSRSNGAGFAEPAMGWQAVVQLVAAMALVVPVAVVMPRLEIPDLFGGTESSPATTAASSATTQTVVAGETPAGLTAAEWADIQTQIAAANTPAATGPTASALLPPDDTQIPRSAPVPRLGVPGGVTAEFVAAGAALVTAGADRVHIATTSVAGITQFAQPKQVGTTVEYRRGVVTEWFRERLQGLEHGYTIDQPIGSDPLLVIEVEVANGTPVAIDDTTVRILTETGEALWYRGLHSFDAADAALPAWLEVLNGAITITVDTSGATYPITIDPIITQDQRLIADDYGFEFGERVAIDGDLSVVSDPGDAENGYIAGAITIFRSLAGNWAEEAKLVGPTRNAGYGWDVAAAAATLSAGALSPSAGSTGGIPVATRCGPREVVTGVNAYQVTTSPFQLQGLQLLCAPIVSTAAGLGLGTPALGATYGNSSGTGPTTLACPSGSLVVGAEGNSGSVVDTIALHCLELTADGGLVNPTTTIEVGGSGGPDRYTSDCAVGDVATGVSGGVSSAIDSLAFACSTTMPERVFVSAPLDDVGGTDSGTVFVYEYDGVTWALAHNLYYCDSAGCDATDPGGFDGRRFGYALATDDVGSLVVGAPSFPEGAPGDAVVFRGTSTLVRDQLGQAPPDLGDSFGAAVSISPDGTDLAVGSPAWPGGASAGQFSWFGNTTGSWTHRATTFGPAPGFGAAIAMDDARAVVGLPARTRAGRVEPGAGGGWIAFDIATLAEADSTFANYSNGFSEYGLTLGLTNDTLYTGLPGAFGPNPTTNGGVGAARWNGTDYVSLGNAQLGSSLLGASVAASDGVAIAGAPQVGGEGYVRWQVDLGTIDAAGPSVTGTGSGAEPADDRLGESVDIDGNRMVVGAPAADFGADAAGAVYVFERATRLDPWVRSVTIESPDPTGANTFGSSVALRGDRLAVGESDQLADQANPGNVYVFQADTFGWTQLGPTIASPNPAYDAFGASVAWVDDDRLAIGAPQRQVGQGAVYATAFNAGSWALPVQLSSGTPDDGDQIGFAVSAASNGGGQYIVAGAPGDDDAGPDAGGFYIWQDIGSGFGAGSPAQKFSDDFNFAVGERAGTAVALDGDRVAIGSIGSQTPLSTAGVHVFEVSSPGTPSSWSETWQQVGDLGVTVTRQPNDYLDLDGGNLVVSRPGDGGEVGTYRYNGIGFGSSVDQFQPSGSVAGDGVGYGVGLDGTTLIAGAPGTTDPFLAAADAGAAYSVELAQITSTFVNPVAGSDWNTASNWDVGLVPDSNDIAYIPASVGGTALSGSASVGAVVADQQLVIAPGSTMTITGTTGVPSVIGGDGVIAIDDDARLNLTGDLVVNGRVQTAAPGSFDPSTLDLNGSVDISGTGQILNFGSFTTGDASSVTVGAGIQWTNGTSSSVEALGGDIGVNTTTFGTGGRLAVATGNTITLAGNTTLQPTTVLDIGIDTTTKEYGEILVGGTLSVDGLLRASVDDAAEVADVYPVISCLECRGIGQFASVDIGTFDVVQTPTTFELQFIPEKTVSPVQTLQAFGGDVDVDGDWAIVGERNAGSPGGQAHVLERVGDDWVLFQTLTVYDEPDTGLDGTGFGAFVNIVGNHAIVAGNALGRLFQYVRSAPGAPFTFVGMIQTSPYQDVDLAPAPSGGAFLISANGTPTVSARLIDADGTSIGVGFPSNPLVPVAPTLGNAVTIAARGAGARAVVADGGSGRVHVLDLTLPSTWTPVATLDGPEGIANQFGNDVAISGDTVVVAERLNPTVGGDGGAVWVYEWDGETFEAPQKLIGSGSEASDTFGTSVDIDGPALVVGAGGAQKQSFPARDGEVYTFESVGGTWTEIDLYRAPDGYNQERLGDTVAISGTTIVAGAFRDTNSNGSAAGAIYTLAAAVTPSVDGLIVAPDGAGGDSFGQSVSIHENVMAVGARFGDGVNADSGAVYVFERPEDTTDWTFTTKLVAADGQDDDGFGFSVALSGSTVDIDDDTGNMVLAVGAPFANGGEGAVYLYRYDLFDVEPWLQTERLAPQATDRTFGLSVALEQRSMAYRNGGFDLVVGAPALDDVTAAGAAYAYRYIVTENPVLSSTLTLLDRIEGVDDGDSFGRDVAIDGKTVVVGAANEAVDTGTGTQRAGALHVYQLDAGGAFADEQRLTQPPGDSLSGDGFGTAVSIDNDVLVAGAFFDTSGPTAGAVYVSERIGSTWSAPTQLNSSLENINSQVGVDVWVENGIVALSSFSGGTLNSGFVSLFDHTSGAWAERQSIEWPRAAVSTGMGVGLALSESGELAIGFAHDSNGASQAGAVYVVPVDMIEASNQILPPGDGDRRFFGSGLDADGEWMIVGEPEEGAGLAGPGRAHLFRLADGEWTYHSELVDPDGVTNNDRYARRVALDGDWAAITDLGDAVHLFHYDGESWQPAAPIPISDPQDGFALALDGDNDRIIIGRAEVTSPGSAAIYDLATSGSHAANTVITPADIIGADRFGSRVAISGNRAFVSASFDASTSGLTSAGSVRVFTRSGTNWTQSAVLTDGAGVNNGRFGGAIDTDGDQLIVGSLGGSSATIFDFSSVTTRSQRISAPGGSSQYAIDVGIEGSVAVVGARYGISSHVPAGTAYVYSKTAAWQLVRTVTATDREFADNFGEAVDVTGTSVLVGAAHDDNDAGVYAGSVWTFSVEPPPDIQLTFDLAEPTNQVEVAPTGIAATDFDAVAVEGTNDSTIAASPLSSIELDGTPLSSINVENTPLSSIALDPNSVIGRLSLISVDIDGGWQQILADSSTLSELPLQQITLAQAFADAAVAGTLASTPLSSIDVNGTPLSSIPLSSIVLGELPLSSIPLSSIDGGTVDWCDLVQPYVPSGTTCAEINELSLIEATLAGTPLSSIPLSSIPLSSIDLSDTPLSSIPLSSIEFAATPLSSIPLSSIPLSSIGVAGSPLSSIPLSSIPLSSIPLSSIPLSSIPLSSIGATLENTPLSSIDVNGVPLSSIPLSSIPLSSIPLSSIDVEAAPLSSIPLSSILLGPLPLSSIPLSSIDNNSEWCDLLADLGEGVDCDHGIDPESTTLTEVLVRGVPLSSIPLSSIPLSSIPLSSIPLSSIPLSSIPLSSIPLSSIPLSSIPLSSITLDGTPLGSIPLSSIPLSSIDVAGSPLSSIPLGSIDVATTPLSSIPLSSIPLSSIPLSSIPLSSISLSGTPLSSIPLSSIDILGSPLSSIPLSSIPLSSIAFNCSKVDCALDSLGDAVLAGAIPATATIDGLEPAFDGLRLSDLADALLSQSSADVRAAVDNLDEYLSSLTSFDDVTLGEIAAALSLAPLLALGDLEAALADVSYIDLAGALLDPATGDPLDPALVEGGLRTRVDTYANGLDLTVRDLDAVGDSTLGDLLDGRPTTTLADVWPVLSFISLEAFFDATGITVDLAGRNLADVEPSELGTLVLLSLFGDSGLFDALPLGELLIDLEAAGALEGFTLADLLLALVGAGDLPFGGFDFTDVDVGELPASTVAGVTFAAMFAVDSTTPRTVELTVELPASASYIPGTGVIASDFPAATEAREPKIGENTLTWTLPAAAPGTTFTASFDVRPTLQLGSTALVARARIHGTEVRATAFASVQVVEGLEINDTPAQAVPSATDTIYLTYISTATDVDVFAVPIADNDVLALELSNLSQDFDVALWYRPADGVASTGSPLTNVSAEAPVFPITDPDQTGADAEPLEDFPRLDDIDPALQLVAISNSAGTESETIVTDRLPAGDYFIEVYGRNGVTSRDPAALQIQVQAAEAKPECVNTDLDAPAASGPLFNPVGSTTNTLFLVNEQRLEQLHGSAARADVLAKLDEITTFLTANEGFGIRPAVVSIDGFESVRTAYDAWDADTCNVGAANAVVSAINAIAVDPLRDQLTHVVIVGGDDVIPMARLQDATAVANEYDFRHEFDGKIAGANPDGANSFTSAAWDRHYLSDDPYGESAARSLGNRYLYVTDVALGRLVESPDEIVQSLDHFIEYQGSLDVQSATVLGYDFLVDGSEEIAAELVGAGLNVDDEFADGKNASGNAWSRAEAEQALLDAGQNELISLNAHFDHYRALPAEGDKVVGFDDNLIATEVELLVGNDAFEQSLLFSMGCHSGLAVPNGSITSTNQDWAEAISRIGGIYVANTGFGYGDTEAVAYTERLMSRFSEFVTAPVRGVGVAPTTVGQALMFAKNDYVATLGTMSVYDEKALMESTFYGLPFYQVGLAPTPLPAPPDTTTVPDADGNAVVPVSIDATNEMRDTDSGTYYTNVDDDGDDQTIVAPGRPIQPSTTTDVSVVDDTDPARLDEVAHGAIVVGMTSTFISLTDPVVATPIFDASSQQPEPALGDVNFPARPITITTTTGPAGRRQTMVAATGQYRSAESIQRLDDDLDVVVYYADPIVTDFVRPRISEVNAVLEGGLLTVTMRANDSAGVDRVFLLVASNPQLGQPVDWIGIDLRQVGALWSGSVDLGAGVERAEFIVQAKDVNGNVGVSTNKATNFSQDEQPPLTPPPSPTLAVTVAAAHLDAASGWYTGDVVVSVQSDTPATVRIDGAEPQLVDGSFTITGDGVHTYSVTNASGQIQSGIIRIDTTGAPSIVIGAPAIGASYVAGNSFVDVRCTDPSLASCVITIDGQPVRNNDPLPTDAGQHTVSVTATDAFGLSASQTGTFTIVGAPKIIAINGPLEPLPLGATTAINATFTDTELDAGVYTVVVDWGDGSSSNCTTIAVDGCTATAPTIGAYGTLAANHAYAAAGIYTIGVTVTDETGLVDTASFTFVVVYDSAAGQVNGSGKYLSGSEALIGRPLGDMTAKFAFNAKYKNGDPVPQGKTKLKLGKKVFDFESTGYDYLLLGATVATAGGVGEVDGIAGYRFMVQAVDQGSTDYFRITIWNEATGELVYDNGALFAIGDEVTSGGGVKIKQ